MEKAMTISIRNTGKTRHVKSVRRRGTLKISAPKKSNNDDSEKSVASAATNVKKLKKDFKSMKKAFTMVNTQIKKLKEADSDLSGSEDDDDQSHFQMDAALLFAQVDKEF
jgi:predicted translin family RNA/ssDNA-binding protein